LSEVDDVRARLDIVDTVSAHVALKKAGRNFKAPCPFHSEKTPSFVVSPERQSWHCFGACATGGDVFSFVMRAEGLDFGEALRLLAQKAGVTLLERRTDPHRQDLHSINQVAARFFQDILESSDGNRARAYLEGRGVNSESILQFGLGLSPRRWEGLKSHLLRHELTVEQGVAAGLLHQDDRGNVRDFFHGRLMFPIHDREGRIAGFGARALDDSNPKYLNTPATPIFDKRSILYGLHLAARAIRSQSKGIVVEGYMDVIAAHQFGHANVVASMGTALTEQQVAQLRPLATNFVLALDPDTAGQEATLRSLTASWRIFEVTRIDNRRRSVGPLYRRDPLSVSIAELPSGRDPDALIREDATEWERLTGEPKSSEDFYIEQKVRDFDLETAGGKAQAAEVLKPVINSSDGISQHYYMDKIARVLDVSYEALRASLGSVRPRRASSSRWKATPAPEVSSSALADDPEHRLEDYTLSLLLSRSEFKERVANFPAEHFHKIEDREVFTRWLSCTTMDELVASLDDSLHGNLDSLTQRNMAVTDHKESEAALDQCLLRLEERHLRALQESLLASEEDGGPPGSEIEAKVADVNAELKSVLTRLTG